MPVSTRSRRNRNKDESPTSVPEVPGMPSPPGEFVTDSKLPDVTTHLNTISAFLEHTPNVPRSVIESFHALQSIISGPHKNCEDYFHRRSIVIQGIPELPLSTIPSVRQADVEAKVTEVLDALGVEARPWAVFRMGRWSETKPRLTKVILPARSQYLAILGRAKSLRDTSKYKHIFIRASLTEEERRKEYDLRKEAREKNQSLGHKEYVVYRGQVVKISDIPNMREGQEKPQGN
ncbi:hypothetical protein Y032_0651g1151 [Ancylostoma ceylanicum]|uniref:Uncharacterized protein n=1 Tax=Ancylostoma ceylanicum TaxID=53326 RepID=A0A016WBM1_9BILA|nr:hypothetical protein Y032_0813g2477 [Ancylostoma ceylanicum]EYC39567.1 hypothetical protein Y032_0651g1151 [Ancylostoma ceylanicum]